MGVDSDPTRWQIASVVEVFTSSCECVLDILGTVPNVRGF